MIRPLAAGIGLLVAANTAAQSAPDWLRDVPSVQSMSNPTADG